MADWALAFAKELGEELARDMAESAANREKVLANFEKIVESYVADMAMMEAELAEKRRQCALRWGTDELDLPQQPQELIGNATKDSLFRMFFKFCNTANKDALKRHIGESLATSILQLREESPVPFKNLDDFGKINFSSKQAAELFENWLLSSLSFSSSENI